MLGSLLSLLVTTAAVLLAPAFAGVLRLRRHAHRAGADGSTQRQRLAIAASLVGLAALGVSALLDAGAVEAAMTSAVLAGSVLAWGSLVGSWAIRGVVAWALIVAAALSSLAWLLHRLVTASLSPTGTALGTAAWLALLIVLTLERGTVQRWIGARVVLPGVQALREPARRPPHAVIAVAAVAAAGCLATVTVVGSEPVSHGEPGPAGRTKSPGTADTALSSTTGPSSAMVGRSPGGRDGSEGTGLPETVDPSSLPGLPLPSSDVLASAGAVTPTRGVTANVSPSATKTPGYLKDKLHRPSHGPSRGPGDPISP